MKRLLAALIALCSATALISCDAEEVKPNQSQTGKSDLTKTYGDGLIPKDTSKGGG